MAVRKLVKDAHKYRGKFVAVSSFNDNNVIAFGDDPLEVIEDAEKECPNVVILFVPRKNASHVYLVTKRR